MSTVLSYENIKNSDRVLFLGPEKSIQRYDNPKHNCFMDLWRKQEDYRWMPDRYPLSKDRQDYENLTEVERFVFESNLKWQTATDSLLSRSIHNLGQYVSNHELELCMGTWAAMENVHSFSYTHILQNITKNPSVFFDSILKDEFIKDRMNFIKGSYDGLFDATGDVKQKIFDSVLATQITEGLSFYTSFICSFWFRSRGRMEGSGKIVGEIARDENLHVAITQNIMRIFKDFPEEGFQDVWKSNQDKIYETYKMAVEFEKEWAEYLFSKGSLLGLNPQILGQYVEWLADNRLRSLGLQKLYGHKSDPLGSWIKPYFDSSINQNAPQETEIDSYKVDAANTEIDYSELDAFAL